MTDNNIKKWYVVRAVSGQENKVKAIETEISRLEWKTMFQVLFLRKSSNCKRGKNNQR
jgi:transcription antitermination factor NusG